jgi:hypothetical protein
MEGRGFTGCGKTLRWCRSDPALREKNLALRIFMNIRDSSSPAAPQNDSPNGFFRSLFSPRSYAASGHKGPIIFSA